MKTVKAIALAIILAVSLGGSGLWAAGTGQTNYTCTDVTVSSATVPTSVASPGRITTWIAHVESSPASDPVRFIFYTGSTPPTAVPSPSAYYEVDSGNQWYDAITCDAPSCNDAIGQGMAAYLKSGSTATVIDVCTR